jgi:hypothetical protein
MHLRCSVCAAVQPVTTPDYEDEDPRTQAIRRTFRAEHIASCGVGSVSFILHTVEAIQIDRLVWDRYCESRQPPQDVQEGADGFFTRPIMRDGQLHRVRVCEDCWESIPRYVDFPAGLISPESDGAAGAVPKWRPGTVETDSPERAGAIEHLWKVVCLPCYLAAFARVYPEAVCPEMNDAVVGDGAPVEPPPSLPPEALGHVIISRWDREAVV